MDEVLRPYLSGHAITYNHYPTENFQKPQHDRNLQNLKACIKALLAGVSHISDTLEVG